METAFIIQVFLFLTANIAPCHWIEQGQAPSGLAGEKSSSLRCGIFPRQTLHNPGRRQLCM